MGFELFNEYTIVCIVLFVVIGFLLWLLPVFILSNSIKGLGKNQSNKMYIANENDLYYELDSGVRIYKKWHDVENDCYVCVYGYYIPVRNFEDVIISFVFIRK